MSYNLSQVTANGTGMLEFTQGVNSELMFGMLGILALLMIWLIFVITFYKSTEQIGKAIAGSSFICFILSVLLRAVGLVPDLAIYILLILAAGSLVLIRD